jgi:repressor LexA
MTFGEKLKQARNDAGLKQSELAKILGTTNTTISNWEKGVSKPDLDMLSYICGALKVRASYFLQPIVPDDGITIPEFNMVKKYRALDDYGRKLINLILDTETARIKEYGSLTTPTIVECQSHPDSKIIVLPYFRAGVSAGSGIFILGNEAEDEIELPNLSEYAAADFAIDVNGQSMEPEFSDKDIALVNQDAEMQLGDIGVFVINGNAFIKELGEKELISHNKDFKNIAIHSGDNIVCMGKVIGKVK